MIIYLLIFLSGNNPQNIGVFKSLRDCRIELSRVENKDQKDLKQMGYCIEVKGVR